MHRLLPLLVLIALLGACASLPPAVTDRSHALWQQHQRQLLDFNDWHLRGRVALFVDDDVYNLGLDWLHSPADRVLTLEAALGQGVIRIRRLDGLWQLSTAEGETRSAPDAEALLRETTGWDIPVGGLEYWIRGVQRPGSDCLPTIDAQGRLQQLQQDGWRINYLEYGDATERTPMPRKLYMKRGRIGIKIVIDQWQKIDRPRPDDLFPRFD